MEKKITIGEPFINCYSKFAAITSILAVNDKAKVWGYLNYSTLMYMRSEVNDLFWMELRSDENTIWEPEWKLCPFIEGEQIETGKIVNKGAFTNFIIRSIDNNFCIYADLCVASIDAYNTKSKRQHDLFIYGYNLKEHTAICRDYFSLKYEEKVISFDELDDGFNRKYGCEERKDYNFIFRLCATDIIFNNTIQEYCMYIKKMLYPINLFSYEPGTDKRFQFFFGLEAYQYLFDDYNKECLGIKDLRPFYVIKNHLQLLTGLSDYFSLPFMELLTTLHKQYDIVCSLAIKYTITKNVETKKVIIDLAHDFVSYEKEYLEKIIMY